MRIEADVKIFRRSLGPVLACVGRGPRNTATKQITLETRNGRVFAYGQGTGVFVTSQLAAVTPMGVRQTCSVNAKDFMRSLKAATGEKIKIITTRRNLQFATIAAGSRCVRPLSPSRCLRRLRDGPFRL